MYTIEDIVHIVRPVAPKHGIPRIFLFGSYARGDATEASDVDLVVDETGVQAVGLAWAGIYDDFCEAFGAPIDMVLLRTLHSTAGSPAELAFRREVLTEMTTIYAGER